MTSLKTLKTTRRPRPAMNTSEPFRVWERALKFNESGSLQESRNEFKLAAQSFFNLASTGVSTSRALFEYSTLMDAFSSIQEARILKSENLFDESFAAFSKSTEILRATMHFGFLSGYVSGCASVETSLELEASDDSFQGLKNAISLFEQSKLTLSFRDERHPIVKVIDTLIKYSISKAFLVESQILSVSGDMMGAEKKVSQSEAVMRDYEKISRESGKASNVIDYFPVEDWNRALMEAFLVSFPESDGMWLGNLGVNSALVETLAEERVDKVIKPNDSIHWSLKPSKGRIRVKYVDVKEKKSHDEGCVTVI